MNHGDCLKLAEAAAREAGQLLRERPSSADAVRAEVGKDLKLEADLLAERHILRQLRAGTSFPVLSEEDGADAGFSTDREHWVVDPLDGTLNFGRHLPLTCVSVGLWKAEAPVLGVVYDFERDELFSGHVGQGAFCNGEPIRVSSVSSIAKAVLATGFPSGRRYDDAALMGFCRKVQAYKKVRLLGSAALSLAWLAAGRLDAYAEDDIWYWDVAAGLALVTAAGGHCRRSPGSSRFQFRVMAWAEHLPPPDGSV